MEQDLVDFCLLSSPTILRVLTKLIKKQKKKLCSTLQGVFDVRFLPLGCTDQKIMGFSPLNL